MPNEVVLGSRSSHDEGLRSAWLGNREVVVSSLLEPQFSHESTTGCFIDPGSRSNRVVRVMATGVRLGGSRQRAPTRLRHPRGPFVPCILPKGSREHPRTARQPPTTHPAGFLHRSLASGLTGSRTVRVHQAAHPLIPRENCPRISHHGAMVRFPHTNV